MQHTQGVQFYLHESCEKSSQIYDSVFYFNQAGADGGAVYCKESSIQIDGDHSEMNSAINGGFLHLLSCSLSILDKYDIIWQ